MMMAHQRVGTICLWRYRVKGTSAMAFPGWHLACSPDALTWLLSHLRLAILFKPIDILADLPDAQVPLSINPGARWTAARRLRLQPDLDTSLTWTIRSRTGHGRHNAGSGEG
jgi:hypothetical protein